MAPFNVDETGERPITFIRVSTGCPQDNHFSIFESFIREIHSRKFIVVNILFFSLKLENTCEGIKNCIQKNPLINRKFGRYI